MSVLPPISNNENHCQTYELKKLSKSTSNTKAKTKLIGAIPLSENQVVVYQPGTNKLMPKNTKNLNKSANNNSSSTSLRLNINVNFNQTRIDSGSKNLTSDPNSLSTKPRRQSQVSAVKNVSMRVSNSPSPEKRPLKKSNVSTGGMTSSQSRRLSSTRTDSNSHNSLHNSARNPSNQRRVFNSGALPTTHELNAERIDDNSNEDYDPEDEECPEKMERIRQWLVSVEGAHFETEQVVVEEGPRQTDKSIHIIYNGD